MSQFVGIVPPSDVTTRQTIACGDWITRVRTSNLDPVMQDVLTDPRNLAAWWPRTSERKAA